MRIWYVIVMIAALVFPVQGQAQQAQFVTVTFQSAVAATGNGIALPVDRYTAVAVQVTITNTATVTFESTSDGTTWVSRSCTSIADTVGSLVTTATSSGVYQCNIAGLQQFRVRVSSFTSGTVTATGRASTAIFSRSGGGGGGLTGISSFPGSPTVGQTVMITDDSAVGACDSAAGAAVTICYWTGAVWAAVGDGSGAGAGDISDVWACATANCNALTAAAGDSLDAGSADSIRPTTRSTSLPGTCSEGQHHQDTDSGGTETYICTDVNTWVKLVAPTDNTATATALAANGANGAVGTGCRGVDASGAAEDCADFMEEPGSNGLVARTAANTAAARTIIGTANQVDLTNGDGAAGNPTVALSSTLVIPGPGVEFTETAGDSTCAAGNYWIKANSTTTGFRKCQNGTLSDLDTGGGGSITGTVGATDLAVPKANGTGGSTLQASGCTISALNLMTCPGGFASTGGTGMFVFTEGAPPGAGASAGEHNAYFDSGDSKLKSHENGGSIVTYVRTADNLSVMASTTSDQFAGVLSDESGSSGGFVRGTSGTLTTPTINTPTFGGSAPTLADGVTWTFNPSGTSSGLNVGSQAGAPSVPNNGDVWYDSTASKLYTREGGVTKEVIPTGAGTGDLTSIVAGAGISCTTCGGADVTVTWEPNTYVGNVTLWNAANASRTLTAGLSGATDPVITFSDATVNVSTGALQVAGSDVVTATSTVTKTNLTLDCEGTGNTCTIPKRLWFPAAGINNTTGGSIWDLPTTSPAVVGTRTGTNTTKGTLDFADASSLTASLIYMLPATWTGNVDARVYWQNSSATLTGDVVWQIAIACAGDGDSDDPAYTDDVFTADTVKGTANLLNITAVNTVTTTGTCAADDLAHIRIKRDAGHGSDNFANTARLIGVELVIREAM